MTLRTRSARVAAFGVTTLLLTLLPAAEGAGEIGALTLLQKDNRDEEKRDDDVNDGQEDDHATAF